MQYQAGAHSKVPSEQLYLETASMNMSQTMSTRRIIHLQTILQRSEGKLIRNIYQEMKADPRKRDWSEMVKRDFEKYGVVLTEDEIREMDTKKYKSFIKVMVRDHSFIYFKEMQAGHQKGRQNHHENLNSPQNYLTTNKLTNKQVSLLFNLKCQSVSGVKNSFHHQYPGDLHCPLCKIEVDSQNHILTCSVLKKNTNIDPEIAKLQISTKAKQTVQQKKSGRLYFWGVVCSFVVRCSLFVATGNNRLILL